MASAWASAPSLAAFSWARSPSSRLLSRPRMSVDALGDLAAPGDLAPRSPPVARSGSRPPRAAPATAASVRSSCVEVTLSARLLSASVVRTCCSWALPLRQLILDRARLILQPAPACIRLRAFGCRSWRSVCSCWPSRARRSFSLRGRRRHRPAWPRPRRSGSSARRCRSAISRSRSPSVPRRAFSLVLASPSRLCSASSSVLPLRRPSARSGPAPAHARRAPRGDR